MPQMKVNKDYYTAKQVKEKLNINPNQLYAYVRNGTLQHVYPPGKKLGVYLRSEVDQLAEELQTFRVVGQETPTEKDIDAVFYLAQPEDMEGIDDLAVRLFGKRSIGASRRRSWLAKEPRGNYVMRRKSDGKVVAYFYVQALEHQILVDYLHQKIRGWQITEEHIMPFTPGEPRECFIGAIGTDPDAGDDLRSAYGALLLRGVKQDLVRLAGEGVIIGKLYAASSNFDGTYMCLHLGMELWEPPSRRRLTFVLDVKKSKSFLFQPYKKALAEWRRHQESAVASSETDKQHL
jgi:hypothetical protein